MFVIRLDRLFSAAVSPLVQHTRLPPTHNSSGAVVVCSGPFTCMLGSTLQIKVKVVLMWVGSNADRLLEAAALTALDCHHALTNSIDDGERLGSVLSCPCMRCPFQREWAGLENGKVTTSAQEPFCCRSMHMSQAAKLQAARPHFHNCTASSIATEHQNQLVNSGAHDCAP